jgi:hypothetical protein
MKANFDASLIFRSRAEIIVSAGYAFSRCAYNRLHAGLPADTKKGNAP